MTTTTTTAVKLTEFERSLIELVRQLDEREQRHVYLAAESVKATAEKRERLRW